jgi:hypothetical protein
MWTVAHFIEIIVFAVVFFAAGFFVGVRNHKCAENAEAKVTQVEKDLH